MRPTSYWLALWLSHCGGATPPAHQATRAPLIAPVTVEKPAPSQRPDERWVVDETPPRTLIR